MAAALAVEDEHVPYSHRSYLVQPRLRGSHASVVCDRKYRCARSPCTVLSAARRCARSARQLCAPFLCRHHPRRGRVLTHTDRFARSDDAHVGAKRPAARADAPSMTHLSGKTLEKASSFPHLAQQRCASTRRRRYALLAISAAASRTTMAVRQYSVCAPIGESPESTCT
jgi:hypothetical protein